MEDNGTDVVSIMSSAPSIFSSADYAVFVLLFSLCGFIGVYFAVKGRSSASPEQYLLAGRSFHGVPIAFSLTASFMSALTVLGTPAEIYRYGTMFYWFVIAYVMVAVITAHLFVPIFYKMGISSTYEYLEQRFDRSVRIAGTCTFTIQTVLYMGMVVYMPALALQEVTGLNLNMSIIATSLVCIFYTAIGGMRAVIWTDVVQCTVMWIGFLAIVIKGSNDVGGFGRVWQIADEGERIDFWHFDLDPRVRHSFWSLTIGGTLMWLSVYAINQSMVQRYFSCKSLFHAKLSLYVNVGGLLLIITLASLSGLVMYAVYHNCDPLSNKDVRKSDQLVPYLVMDILGEFPGLPGLFVASAYSGTLSTVSTGISGLSCSTFEDFIKPYKPNLRHKHQIIIAKGLVVMYGLLALCVAFLASLADRLLTIALKMFGIIGGPLLGVFCLGLFTRIGNSYGAHSGLYGGLLMGLWMAVGSFIHPPGQEFVRLLNTTTAGCVLPKFDNVTSVSVATLEDVDSDRFSSGLYALSYCHYSTLLFLVSFGLGALVSVATGGIKRRKMVPANLLVLNGRWCGQHRSDESEKENATAMQPLKADTVN